MYYDTNYGYIAVSSVVTGNDTVLTDYYASWNEQPVWGRDGRIVFVSFRDGLASPAASLRHTRANGSLQMR